MDLKAYCPFPCFSLVYFVLDLVTINETYAALVEMKERGFGLTVHSNVLILCIHFLNMFAFLFSRYANTNIHTSKENPVTAFCIHYTITHACLSK
jgi:hypothetical protein